MNVEDEYPFFLFAFIMIPIITFAMAIAVELALFLFIISFIGFHILILKAHQPYFAIPPQKKILVIYSHTLKFFALFFSGIMIFLFIISYDESRSFSWWDKSTWWVARSWLDQNNVPPPPGFESWSAFFQYRPYLFMFCLGVLAISMGIVFLPELVVQTGLVKSEGLKRIRQLHDFYDEFVPIYRRFWNLPYEYVVKAGKQPGPKEWFEIIDAICLPHDFFDRLPFLLEWDFIKVTFGRLRFVSIKVVTTVRKGIFFFLGQRGLVPTFLRNPDALMVDDITLPIPKDLVQHLEEQGAVDFEDFDNMGTNISIVLRLEDGNPNRPVLEGLKTFWQAHGDEYLAEVERLKIELRQELKAKSNLRWWNLSERRKRRQELKAKRNLLNELLLEFPDR